MNMTFEEFDTIWQEDGMYIVYNGFNFKIMEVNRQERLLGLWDEMCEEIYWVRCENCIFLNGGRCSNSLS